MKIAIAQLNPTIGNLSGNAEKILKAAQESANQGVRLLLTPELSICGYPPKDLLLNGSFVESISQQLQQLAQDLPPNLAVLVGTVECNPHSHYHGQKPLFNSIALLEGGKIKQIFHKRLLPTYDVFDEHRYFEPGENSNFFILTEKLDSHTIPVKIGVTICEDLWNDEQFWGKRSYRVNPLEDLVKWGVDLVVNLSASPYSIGKQNTREAMLSHSAIRYGIPIIYTNQIGGNDDLLFDGTSFACNRIGEVISRAKHFQTDLNILEFELPTKDLIPGNIASLPSCEDEEVFSALVLGLRDYAYKCGFRKVVLGLSGGIDSALVAVIAKEAFGADNVLGVLMPSPYSSEHSVKDAEDLVKNLGIQSQKLPLERAMKSYDTILEPLFSGTEFGVAEENIQARIRGNLLMAIANKFNYLLISTGNKSEMAVGYCTLYGDMSGGFSVLADVPKTRVFSICQWLNQNQEIIPSHILSKPPSAELKPNQTDQDTLPSYEILDDILYRIIEQNQSLDEILQAGHDPEIVKKVMKMLSKAEFKRQQSPPGLKITSRAFGTGWRMPIASRWITEGTKE